ncbi:MAG TPA: nucleotidyltransferase domain-containing protein [Thermoanaerobaculia bacterium]|nr:nucleotidyltransferase domain-containing protein [Thermoanaerobaculia bacterium]
MDRSALIERLEGFFRHRPQGLVAVYLFGSRARGGGRDGSDVDLGLLFAEEPPVALGGPAERIADALERELGLPVEAVVLSRAPADLVHRVLRDGVLVLETDRSARIRFEVARRREYLDLLPVLREYRHRQRSAS